MIININSIENKIVIFHDKYIHLHGFIKLEAQTNNAEYVIIVQVLDEKTITDYILTRQKLKNVELTEYIQAELETELQYVVQGRPIVFYEKDKNNGKEKYHIFNVFFHIEDLMEKGILKPHSMFLSDNQDDKYKYLKRVFDPNGIFMGTLASEKKVDIYFPMEYLMYHSFVAGATGSGKSNYGQIFIDGVLQHNAQVILNDKGTKVSMLAIDMHDEYALGCLNYGVYHIYEETEYDQHLFGDWFYLYPNGSTPPAELNAIAQPCRISFQEIRPENLFSIGSFNDLQVGALFSASRHRGEDYITALLEETDYIPPGNHSEMTIAAVRRRIFWLDSSDMFQDWVNSNLSDIIEKLEKGAVIIFNVSMITDLEQFLFNSIVAKTLFDIRKSLKSSSTLSEFRKKLGDALPNKFLEKYDKHLEEIYIKSGDQLKDTKEMPVIIFTIEEAPSLLRPEMMRYNNVFKDISRQGRKFNLALKVISQQYSPIDNAILDNMNTIINLPLRSDNEKMVAARTLGGGITHNDIESLTGTRGIALVSAIWLTNFQKLLIPLYDDYFLEHSKSFYENYKNQIKKKEPFIPKTSI